MKKTKIIIPALGMLLLSTAASVSGTVAWFSVNTAINVTGMSVKTKVAANLQIAAQNQEANYSNEDLPQSRFGMLLPSSTIDGEDFYWTTNAKFNGDAESDAYTLYNEDTAATDASANKTAYDDGFNSAYGFNPVISEGAITEANKESVAYAYVDYSFYLKAYYSAAGEKIALTKCNMLYNNGVVASGGSWRVALFAHQVNANTEEADSATVAASGALKSILDFGNTKSLNQNEVTPTLIANGTSASGYYTDALLQNAAAGNADGKTYYYQASGENGTPKAVSGAAVAPTAVSNPNAEAIVATSTAAGTLRYKVVVRLWLEGEDVSCTTDTFALLNQAWTLDLAFSLGSNPTAVTAIGSALNA